MGEPSCVSEHLLPSSCMKRDFGASGFFCASDFFSDVLLSWHS